MSFVKTIDRANNTGRVILQDDSVASGYLNNRNRYVTQPAAGAFDAFLYGPMLAGAAKSNSTAAGVAFKWTASPIGKYQVERSHDSASNFAPETFYRITPTALTTPVFTDLFLNFGQKGRYRIYTEDANGATVLYYELDVTQVSFGLGDNLMTVLNGGYSSTALNIIENKTFYTFAGEVAVRMNSDYRFLFRNCRFIGSGSGIQTESGQPQIEVENCFFLGIKPPSGNANKCVGRAVALAYYKYFRFEQNTIIGMGGMTLQNCRNANAATPGFLIRNNIAWNINRIRVDANGEYIKSDWSNYHEEGNTGLTKLSEQNPPEVIGRNICNFLQVLNSGNAGDNLSTAVVGGGIVRGNIVIGEAGAASLDDAFNFYEASNVAVSVWCANNNPSRDFNWVPGQPWNMGSIKTPPGYGRGTQSGPGYQSQSGGLLSDSTPNPGKYEAVGSYNTLTDAWCMGLGTQISVQAGHQNRIVRLRLYGSRIARDGKFTSISGGSNTLPSFNRYDGGRAASDTGQQFWSDNTISGLRAICPDSFNIDGDHPYGMDLTNVNTAGSTDNQLVRRDATVAEMNAGFLDYMKFCSGLGIQRFGCVPA